MVELSKLSPSKYPILIHMDMLSIERMEKALFAKSNEKSKEDQLRNLIPVPQEFHKDMKILQVS